MQGDVKDVLLLDVIPLSLGIETLGAVATKLIERNTTIPTARSQVFSTAADNQTSVEIHIVQGERPMAADNKSLGRFILDGIPPSSRGMPQIEVAFDVDANGILNVTAKDKSSGKTQSIRIEASSGLTEADITRMQNEAAAHAEEDKQKREMVEAKNMAEMLVYTAEKAIKDAEGKIPEGVKQAVNEKIETLKKVKDGQDAESIKRASDDLSQAMQKIGESMTQGDKPADSGNGGNEPKDAKFEEKNDDDDTAEKK